MSRTSTASSSPPEPLGAVPDSPAAIRAALRALDVTPSRRWGQSFLADPFVADAEAALVETAPGEPILEIGPGLGMLTAALLRRGLGPVRVIERDPRLAGQLRRLFADRIEVIEGDALEVALPEARAVVGNLPFSVATPLLLRLWRAAVPRIVALVQREVAERLAASPGSRQYGRLSVLAAYYGTVELFRTVPATAFSPTPLVEGRIVRFCARAGPAPCTPVGPLEELLRRLFGGRRKQLHNLMGRVAPDPSVWDALARSSGWPADWRRRRPEELGPEAYFALCRTLQGRARG